MKKTRPVRWNRNSASTEFNISPKTLSKRLRWNGILPGPDGCFSTAEICRAVYGDLDGEKLRLVREQANERELKNEQTRGRLVDADDFRQLLTRGFSSMLSVINSANLEREDKDKLINALRDAGESVARAGQPVADDSDQEPGE